MVKFNLNYILGGIGAYVLFFNFGGWTTLPLPFITENTIKEISIITEPNFNNSSFDDPHQTAFYVGRTFDQKAKVKIDVIEGTKRGYIVLAQAQNVTNSIHFKII